MKLLLYCTKAKPYLYDLRNIMGVFEGYNVKQAHLDHLLLNGKIVAECDFDVEEITPEKYWHSTEDFDYIYNTGTVYYDDLLKKSCLMDYQLDDYLGCEDGYAIHIKNLHIFDKPKELNEYMSGKFEEWNYRDLHKLKKAPQNMQYVSTWYCDEISMQGSTYVLISIKPEWLCKILNGEKTIEVRKKVLKEMLK